MLHLDGSGVPRMSNAEPTDEWHMCWECQRCMAVCPTGALSICGKSPESRAFLQIPEDHYISCLVGFGWPEYNFQRGVQRSDALKINRITGKNTKELL